MKSPLVIFDSVDGVSVYHTADVISRFVARMNDKARTADFSILWIAVDSQEFKGLNDSVARLCDEIIE